MHEGHIESTRFPRNPLDVLAQHVLGCACGAPFSAGALYEEVSRAAPYRHLTRTDFDRVIDLVATGSTLKANGLVETEVIHQISSRLIVNRTALKTRPEEIGAWIARFREALTTL